MKVRYRKKFLKQLARLPLDARLRIERFVFEEVPNALSRAEVGSIEQMQGYKHFRKPRFGSYRVGIKQEGDALTFQVVMDRKDIYRFFP